MNFDIKKIFSTKYKKNLLPNFLLFHGPVGKYHLEPCLDAWIEDLLKHIIHDHSGNALANSGHALVRSHPDILFLPHSSTNSSLIKAEDLTLVSEFLKFNPRTLKQKFIVIKNIYAQSLVVLNKLLKVLEEAPVKLTVMATNPSSISSLPTIKSRAIHIRLSEKDLTPYNSEEAKVNSHTKEIQHSIPWLQKELKQKNRIKVAALLETICRKKSDFTFQDCENNLKILKSLEVDKNYNLSHSFTSFLSHHTLKNT